MRLVLISSSRCGYRCQDSKIASTLCRHLRMLHSGDTLCPFCMQMWHSHLTIDTGRSWHRQVQFAMLAKLAKQFVHAPWLEAFVLHCRFGRQM